MKEIIIDALKKTVRDRYLTIVLISTLLLSIIFAIIIGLSIHPSELQLVSHYSAFGVTHIYRDQWYYLIVFLLFEPLAALIQSVISIKLFLIKGHSIAIMYAWIGFSVVLIGMVTAMAVLNVWNPI